MQNNEMIFRSNFINAIVKFIIFSLIIYIGLELVIKNQIIKFSFFLFLVIIVFCLFNKKWFKTIFIYDYTLEIKYLFEKDDVINLTELKKITYYKYLSKTPAHFKIYYKNKVLRFDCNEEKARILSAFLLQKGKVTSFYPNN